MRLQRFTVHDHRSVWGDPLEIRLARDVTALVGPNLAGKSNVARALACALDPSEPVDLVRDRPVARPAAIPGVTLAFGGRHDGRPQQVTAEVRWGPEGRSQRSDPQELQRQLPLGDGRVLYAPAGQDLAALVARHPAVDQEQLPELRRCLEAALRSVLADVGSVELDVGLVVRDRAGFALPATAGTLAAGAIGLAHYASLSGQELAAVIIDQPEAWLHPAAQERIREDLVALAIELDAPVLVTTASPFVTPRDADSRVVALTRDPEGRTIFAGAARGSSPQAPLLGGLLRDPGLGAVLDRAGSIPPDTSGVLIVEGGTDEAYLRIAAHVLGRSHELDHVAIHPAGGAMAAALAAVVLDGQSALPALTLLDADGPGRRAKETLVSRFGFDNRRQVTTYAEVIPGYPSGTEAEDLFDWRFVDRFVRQQGERAQRGRFLLRADEWHIDLTTEAKGAFVAWARQHATPADVVRWGSLLDLVAERVG